MMDGDGQEATITVGGLRHALNRMVDQIRDADDLPVTYGAEGAPVSRGTIEWDRDGAGLTLNLAPRRAAAPEPGRAATPEPGQ